MSVALTEEDRRLAHKGLVSEQLWGRLTGRIVKEEAMELSLAERIMDQALGFLRLYAFEEQGSFAPSPLVDIGWHTFILYTEEYEAFCQTVAGRFIHHRPNDIETVVRHTGGYEATVTAMRRHGLAVDDLLWTSNTACGCNGGTECEGSGDGPPSLQG